MRWGQGASPTRRRTPGGSRRWAGVAGGGQRLSRSPRSSGTAGGEWPYLPLSSLVLPGTGRGIGIGLGIGMGKGRVRPGCGWGEE